MNMPPGLCLVVVSLEESSKNHILYLHLSEGVGPNLSGGCLGGPVVLEPKNWFVRWLFGGTPRAKHQFPEFGQVCRVDFLRTPRAKRPTGQIGYQQESGTGKVAASTIRVLNFILFF